MTLLKTLGYGTLLAGAFALSATMALAHDDDGSKASFPKSPTVVIGAEGNALVRGAEVTAVNDDVITARTEWDGASMTWTIDTDSDTDFVGTDNDASDIGDIRVGDSISFSGALTGTLSIDASAVREWDEDGFVDPIKEPKDDNGKGNDHKKGWGQFFGLWNSMKARFSH